MSKSRKFCGTWYCMDRFEDPIWSGDNVKWSIRGKEVCPSTGREHIQWAIYFKNPRAVSGVRKAMPGAHVEIMRGTCEQSEAYCRKDGNFVEHGIMPTQGERKDLHEIADEIVGGCTMSDIAVNYPGKFVQYHRGFSALRSRVMGRRKWKTEIIWLWGPTGTGKSKQASEMAPNAYWKMGGNKWWDGYDGEDDIIIDDYRCDLCTFSYLLRLFDRYPLRVESKGGSVEMLAKRIIVTAPYSPSEMWSGRTPEQLEQLLRRIEHVHFVGHENGTEVPPGNTVPEVQIHGYTVGFE